MRVTMVKYKHSKLVKQILNFVRVKKPQCYVYISEYEVDI
jgi:hypothetical protein